LRLGRRRVDSTVATCQRPSQIRPPDGTGAPSGLARAGWPPGAPRRANL
jgi:hypothetical protein